MRIRCALYVSLAISLNLVVDWCCSVRSVRTLFVLVRPVHEVNCQFAGVATALILLPKRHTAHTTVLLCYCVTAVIIPDCRHYSNLSRFSLSISLSISRHVILLLEVSAEQ